LQKGWVLCQEVMVQGLRAKAQEQAGDRGKVRAEAGWAVRLPQAQAAIVFARNAEQRLSMLPDSLVIR